MTADWQDDRSEDLQSERKRTREGDRSQRPSDPLVAAIHTSDHHRITGVVVRIFPDKGFGFVRDEQTRIERFFHQASCAPGLFLTLTINQTVSYLPTSTAKGPRALEVEDAT